MKTIKVMIIVYFLFWGGGKERDKAETWNGNFGGASKVLFLNLDIDYISACFTIMYQVVYTLFTFFCMCGIFHNE